MKKSTIILIASILAIVVAATVIIVAAGKDCTGFGGGSTKLVRKDRSEYDYQSEYNYDFYSRDKLTISVMAPIEEPYSETNNLISKIEEATNTKLNVTFVQNDAYQDRISTTLAKKEVPDLICRVPNRQQIINQEAAYGLYDLLMQYAPNYVDLAYSYGDTDLLELTDVETNEIFTMMNIRQPECQLSYLVREDWVYNIKDESPELANIYDKLIVKDEQLSWDEFLTLLEGFKNHDANKNGSPSDEIPFSTNEITNLRYAFGIDTRYYFAMDGDEYVPVAYHSQYEDYLNELQNMFAAELLDNKYFERGYAGLQNIMANDSVGCVIYYSEYAKVSTEDLRKNGKTNAKWVGIKPVVGPDGQSSGIQSAGGFEHNFMISSLISEEKAIEIVRFLNWFYTEEGINLLNYGVEGTHHEVKEDKKVLKSEYASFTSARTAGLIFAPLPFYFSYDSYFQCVSGGASKGSLSETDQLFYDALGIDEEGNKRYNFVRNCVCLYTPEWKENSTNLEKECDKFEEKAITGAIYGQSLKNELSGLQNLLKKAYEEGQAAYNEIKNNG